MGGMFYTLQEAAEKLNKTEEEVKQIIEQGKLRGFRDGSSIFLKIDEVEAFVSEESVSVVPEEPQAEEPELAPLLIEPELSQPEEPQAEEPEPAPLLIEPELSQPEEPQAEEPELAPLPVEPELSQPEEQELPSPEFEEEETVMPELERVEPQIPEEEFDMAEMEKIVQEIPAIEAVTAKEIPAAIPKKTAKTPRYKAEPKIKQTGKPQRLSFGQWLLYSLTEDNPVAIFVLVLISCLVLSALAALGYGLYFLHANF